MIKSTIFPIIDKNLVRKEAKILKKHLTEMFSDMEDAILPINFEYDLKPGSAIGDYADKINFFSFMVALRIKF